MAMKITKDMIKRNEKYTKELDEYCKDKKVINEDGTINFGEILYFLGFKIIQQEIKIEKLKKDIKKWRKENGN